MQRYSQVPMICDFLYILSQKRASSLNSPNYSALLLVSSVSFIDFNSSFICRKRKKTSINLSLLLFYKIQGTLITTSSSLPMPTLSLLTFLFPISPKQSESLLILAQVMTFLFISNSFSKNTSSVQETSFLSYKTTAILFCSCKANSFSEHLPFYFLTSTLVPISPSYSQLLLSCQSDEEVPNSSFLNFNNSFFRVSFMLMYSSCIRLNSSSLYSSLGSSPLSALLPMCLYSTYFAGSCYIADCFLGCWPRRSVLLASCISIFYNFIDKNSVLGNWRKTAQLMDKDKE